MEPFRGQYAIVTGGAQGLGEGIVRMLVEGGCSVMVFDVNLTKAKAFASTLSDAVECCTVNVADEASVAAGFEVFRAKFPRLDIMVNCAGIVGPNGTKIEGVSTEDFDRVYEGAYSPCIYMALETYRFARSQHQGQFPYDQVFHRRNEEKQLRPYPVDSVSGRKRGEPFHSALSYSYLVSRCNLKIPLKGNAGMCAYSMSKAAVIGLVKSVGKEYAETGITVNALAPAVVRTEMVENMDQQQVKQLTDKIPAKRQASSRY